jgi:hypothetical protein
VLAASWLLPLLMVVMAAAVHFQVGPWVLGALMVLILRRSSDRCLTRGCARAAAPYEAIPLVVEDR